MRHQKALNIKTLLETSDLAQVMRKGLALNELNQQYQTRIPKQFKGLFRVANFTQDKLIIETANATIRQALLFQQAELLALIQEMQPEISKLNIKVSPHLFSL